ncbi:sulfurtransferase [Clostridium sp. Mt-5]|uniref:Sulfurtransferase n=1 Tax=Clostridium moutaii TaxID=3240932 RepID=A0ABV4BQM2_9CLOT
MKNFVTTKWLKEHLKDDNLIIVDCRGDLLDKSYGRNAYERAHIERAAFVNLSTELSSTPGEHGGRDPLPKADGFKNTAEKLGIDDNTVVVAYDDYKIADAARLCWMLRYYMGHKFNYVLDGGIDKWVKDGNCLSKDIVKPVKKGALKSNVNEDMRVDVNYVNRVKYNSEWMVIDSRTPIRYRGENEPIDKIAGHVPGAVNYYWKENLNEDNTIKDMTCLKERFKDAYGKKEVIVYCGSGIDGTFNFLALDEIGIKARLYSGSWSDWITYKGNNIEKTIV